MVGEICALYYRHDGYEWKKHGQINTYTWHYDRLYYSSSFYLRQDNRASSSSLTQNNPYIFWYVHKRACRTFFVKIKIWSCSETSLWQYISSITGYYDSNQNFRNYFYPFVKHVSGNLNSVLNSIIFALLNRYWTCEFLCSFSWTNEDKK